MLGVPAALGFAVEPDVPRLAERVIGPADRAARVGPDPVFGLDQEGPVADLVADQLGQGRRAERDLARRPSRECVAADLFAAWSKSVVASGSTGIASKR